MKCYYKTALACLSVSAMTMPIAFGQTTDEDEEEKIFELSPFTVNAEDDKGYRATNTISGTRLNALIKDLPMPIEVITDEFIKDTGATDLREALGYSAGIILTSQNDAGAGNSFSTIGGVHNPEGATSNKNQTTYKVRGFITDSTLRDGYRRQFASDSANIGRVEVIRGPAALLYGIGNFGGIVNYMPKLPPSEKSQDLTIGIGNDGHFRAVHNIGSPLGGAWDAKFNLTSVYEENGSFTELKKDDHTFFAPIFTFKPTEKTDVTLDFEFYEGTNRGTGFQSIRARAGVTDQQDRLERAGFLTFPDKDIRTMRWSGPDTFVKSKTRNSRIQITHKFSDNFNVLLGYNASKGEFDTRDVGGGIETSVGPLNLRDTVTIVPADAVNGDGEFEAGPIDDAIFRGTWRESSEESSRDQLRLEANYSFDLFADSELWGLKNSFLLGYSDESTDKDVTSAGTLQDEFFYWNPTDSSYIRYGYNGDGTAAPDVTNIAMNSDSASNEGTYLVYQGKWLNDRLTFVGGARRDTNGLSSFTENFRDGSTSSSLSEDQSENTTQFGLSFALNERISLYALEAEGIMPNFDGKRDVYGDPMQAVTAKSHEVGVKFDLIEGKLSGTISKYRIEQTGTPIFYWWAPSPAMNQFKRDQDIVYNVADFNPTVEADWRNGAFSASQAEWDSAVSAGSAYQIDDTWYVNASQASGANYMDAVFDNSKDIGGWSGWLYNQDENTNNATLDFASGERTGWQGNLSGDQESHGYEAQINFTPTDNTQFVLNYAYTQRSVVNAGVFPEYPYADGNWDRWAVWYFPDGQWGLTGYYEDGVAYTDAQNTSTWQGRGYGAGETQDDTPPHALSGWGNYKFTDGALSGLSIGLGFQWEDKREYFSGITDGAGQLVKDEEGERVILYTADRLNIDAMVKYDFKIKERNAWLQLNVYNLMDDQDAYGYIYAAPMSYRMQFGIDL